MGHREQEQGAEQGAEQQPGDTGDKVGVVGHIAYSCNILDMAGAEIAPSKKDRSMEWETDPADRG
ncbi:MAG: hypothetical protein PVS2B2_12480 [Candidatus Acidiferrum sp.]